VRVPEGMTSLQTLLQMELSRSLRGVKLESGVMTHQRKYHQVPDPKPHSEAVKSSLSLPRTSAKQARGPGERHGPGEVFHTTEVNAPHLLLQKPLKLPRV
jgi:hypothetical protein